MEDVHFPRSLFFRYFFSDARSVIPRLRSAFLSQNRPLGLFGPPCSRWQLLTSSIVTFLSLVTCFTSTH